MSDTDNPKKKPEGNEMQQKKEAAKLEGELKLLRQEVAELKEILKEHAELARDEAKRIEEEKQKQAEEEAKRQLAEILKQWSKKLDEAREVLKEPELSGENFNELIAEMEKVLTEMEQLLKSDKDWKEVKPELLKKVEPFNQLQVGLEKKLQQQQRAREEKLRKELKRRSEVLKEELRQRRLKVWGKSLDELLGETKTTAEEIKQFAKLENDWEREELEINERFEHFNWLQGEFVKRPKEVGYFRKWACSLEARSWMFVDLQERHMKSRRKSSEEDIKELEETVETEDLPKGERFQLLIAHKLEKMILDNFQSSGKEKIIAAWESIPVVQFQAEMAETMLGVKENTNPAQQFILVVLASAAVAIFSGIFVDSVLHVWGDEIKDFFQERPVLFFSLLIVFGVVAVFAIKRFLKNLSNGAPSSVN